jgi:hypothetical protein
LSITRRLMKGATEIVPVVRILPQGLNAPRIQE